MSQGEGKSPQREGKTSQRKEGKMFQGEERKNEITHQSWDLTLEPIDMHPSIDFPFLTSTSGLGTGRHITMLWYSRL